VICLATFLGRPPAHDIKMSFSIDTSTACRYCLDINEQACLPVSGGVTYLRLLRRVSINSRLLVPSRQEVSYFNNVPRRLLLLASKVPEIGNHQRSPFHPTLHGLNFDLTSVQGLWAPGDYSMSRRLLHDSSRSDPPVIPKRNLLQAIFTRRYPHCRSLHCPCRRASAKLDPRLRSLALS